MSAVVVDGRWMVPCPHPKCDGVIPVGMDRAAGDFYQCICKAARVRLSWDSYQGGEGRRPRLTLMEPQLNEALALALEAAVPMEVARLLGMPPVEQQAMVRPFPDLIGGHGDQLLYGGKQAAEVFAAVATGIAALLLACPGGLDLFGVHWCDPTGGECVDVHGRCPSASLNPAV